MEAVWLVVVGLFIGTFLWTSLTVFGITVPGDAKDDYVQAMTTVVMVNTMLILVLAAIGYFYTQTNPNMQQPYVMFMLHLNMLLSIIGVGVASLYTV